MISFDNIVQYDFPNTGNQQFHRISMLVARSKLNYIFGKLILKLKHQLLTSSEEIDEFCLSLHTL